MSRKAKPGINDITTTNPEIIQYWDAEKNIGLSPSDFLAGSNVDVYWKCEQGHSFKRNIYNMIHGKGINCPVCRKYQIIEGVNDLATTHPELVPEWDTDKNTLKITEVGSGSAKKAWWKCSKGHSWEAVISSRALSKRGCPICANQKLLKGYNDTARLFPEIKNWWDYDKNDLKPDDYIGAHSNMKVFFKCPNGHSWKTSISDFCGGTRCPICASRIIKEGFNDLATTNPELLKEWDYEKNGDVTPQTVSRGTHLKVWWKCERGHSWRAAIYSRADGKGCPKCTSEYQTSLTEKAFAFYLSKQFTNLQENVHLPGLKKRELDIYIPSIKLAVEYDGHNWHKDPTRDIEKDNICRECGITLIRIREEGCVQYHSSAIMIDAPRNHGNLLLLEKPINQMIQTINEMFGISIPKVKNISNDIAEINETFYTYNKSNSLETLYPDIARQWNYEKNKDLKPSMISAKSNTKVWWKCENGHEWPAIVSSRVRGNGCPYCAGKIPVVGVNDLKTLNESLCKQWDYEKNKDLRPEMFTIGSDRKVWWKCDKNHSWEASIVARVKGSGCPYCSGLFAIKGENDLETLYPEIAKQWDYNKNGKLKPSDIVPGSEKQVWWICDKGHSYPAVPRTRTLLGTGCPVCQNKRIQKGYNDLETLHPELAKEWNYEKNNGLLPSEVGGNGGSHKKVWWICDKGHEWPATLASRIGLHTGCPTCAIERNKKRYTNGKTDKRKK